MKNRRKSEVAIIVAVIAGILSYGINLWSYEIPTERIVLPNNLVVLVSEDHSLPMVTCKILVDAGAWRDPADKGGLANLTAEGILLGTPTRSLSEINSELDFMGAELDSGCSRDYATVSMQTLRKNFDRSFEIFYDVVVNPLFPEEEIVFKLKMIMGRIQSQKDDPGEVAEKQFRKALFLTGLYGHPVEGTLESLQNVDRSAAAVFYESFWRPNNAILAIVGDMSLEEVKSTVIPKLSTWRRGEIKDRPFVPVFAKGPETVKEHMPISQANIILGHKGIERGNPDYYPVLVMNYILGGGGFSSRLMKKIRIEEGLAYSVTSSFRAGKRSGSFQISLQTKNEAAQRAISVALGEMREIRRNPVSEEELATAKKYLVGSFPLRLTTQSGVASFFAQVEYFNLGLDYPQRYPSLIGAVTRDDVLAAAKKFLHPEKTILSIVADRDEISEKENPKNE